MTRGTVMWFNVDKGYGLITRDEAGLPDVFVHHTGIAEGAEGDKGVITAHQRVDFHVEDGLKGPQATAVRPV